MNNTERGNMDTTCPKCGTTYEVDKEDFGTTVECEICHARFQVPKPKSTKTKIRVPHNYHTRIQTVEVKSGHGCLSALLGVFLVFAIIVLGYIVLVMGGCTAGFYGIGKAIKENEKREAEKDAAIRSVPTASNEQTNRATTDTMPMWELKSKIDPMTDEVTFFFTTEGTTVGKGFMSYRPILQYRIKPTSVAKATRTVIGDIDCVIGLGGLDDFGLFTENVQLEMRFDNTPMVKIDCSPSSNYKGAFIKDTERFLNLVGRHQKLTIRYDHNKIATFSLVGANRKEFDAKIYDALMARRFSTVKYE